jgi:hypothetical protein
MDLAQVFRFASEIIGNPVKSGGEPITVSLSQFVGQIVSHPVAAVFFEDEKTVKRGDEPEDLPVYVGCSSWGSKERRQ